MAHMDQRALMESIRNKRYGKGVEHHGEPGDGMAMGSTDNQDYENNNGELAPDSAHGAVMESSPNHDGENTQAPDVRSEDHQNVNANSKGKGLSAARENLNSKYKFKDPKEQIHDPKDKNVASMISGDGDRPDKDHLGIDSNEDPRAQGGSLTTKALAKGAKDKVSERHAVYAAQGVDGGADGVADNAEDADNHDDSFQKPPFQAARSRLSAGSDVDGNGRSDGPPGPLAKVRARLDKLRKK